MSRQLDQERPPLLVNLGEASSFCLSCLGLCWLDSSSRLHLRFSSFPRRLPWAAGPGFRQFSLAFFKTASVHSKEHVLTGVFGPFLHPYVFLLH